jgi:gliding motility-associated-like protein
MQSKTNPINLAIARLLTVLNSTFLSSNCKTSNNPIKHLMRSFALLFLLLGFNSTVNAQTGPNDDFDGDGVTNGKEKADGTDPLNGCSLKVTSITLTPSDAWKNGDCDGDGLKNEVDGIDDCDKDGIPNFLDPDTCNIDILMANVFTPNGDGINDEIKPVLLGIDKFVCFKVYNRWGNLVFETKDREKGWDGNFRTQGQGTETFQWLAEGYDRDGKLVRRTGMITLLR